MHGLRRLFWHQEFARSSYYRVEYAHMRELGKWMKLATTAEQERLAKDAGISREYLYQLAIENRKASAKMAGKIEVAAKDIRRKSKGRLPALTRADLAEACYHCPYAKRCLRGKRE